eukprot:4456926-Pyramimonas_sp.AAC.1
MEKFLAALQQRRRGASQSARRAFRERWRARQESFLVCLPFALRVLPEELEGFRLEARRWLCLPAAHLRLSRVPAATCKTSQRVHACLHACRHAWR